jgi:hypothetical protein
MKKRFILIIGLLFFSNIIFSQSDYEKVQNYKNQTKKIEQEIKLAASLSDLNDIARKVEQLRNDFSSEKDLLDKSLYPDNFNSSLEKLTVAIELRKGDFQTIRDLSIQVTYLKDQVDELNAANADLISQIKELNRRISKDEKTIKSLQNLTKQLKASLRQRDELVKTVVDSLLADFIKQPVEADGEIQVKSYKKSEQSNLIYNLQRTVLDNIQFLKVTEMTPEDLAEIKEQQNDFSKMWRKIGPKLISIYSKKNERTAELNYIEDLNSEWRNEIDSQIWKSVNKEFRDKNIAVLPFSNGQEFADRIKEFIVDELTKVDSRTDKEKADVYFTFSDSIWSSKIKPTWLPILLENKLITEAQKDTIENNIDKWGQKINRFSIPLWIYFVAGVALIGIISLVFFRKRKNISVAEEKEENTEA